MLVDLHRLFQRWGRAFARRQRPPAPTPLTAPLPRQVVPLTHQDAARSLVARRVVESLSYKERCLRCDPAGSDPDLLDFSKAFQKELQRRGMPFFAHCYVRSDAEQEALFRKGVTKARAGQSPHNHGMAVDIVHFGKYWDLTNKQWAVIGLIGKEVARRRNVKITWGGDWNFYDPAHWELADWMHRRDIL